MTSALARAVLGGGATTPSAPDVSALRVKSMAVCSDSAPTPTKTGTLPLTSSTITLLNCLRSLGVNLFTSPASPRQKTPCAPHDNANRTTARCDSTSIAPSSPNGVHREGKTPSQCVVGSRIGNIPLDEDVAPTGC